MLVFGPARPRSGLFNPISGPEGFSEAGHVCDVIMDGQDALFQAMRNAYEVLVVDRMIPNLDGLFVVKALCAANVKTPVLFLTSEHKQPMRPLQPSTWIISLLWILPY